MEKTGNHVKSKMKENIKALTFAIIAALLIRTFLFEPFRIPSQSMVPSMLVGDYLFVSKYTYGYSNTATFFRLPILSDNLLSGRALSNNTPKRGDIVVFKLPSNPKINYIKRVIGEPGDKVQIKDEVIYINGIALDKKEVGVFTDDEGDEFKEYIETTLSGKSYNVVEEIEGYPYDNTVEFEVPSGHYFMMGDNRDNSADCRTEQIPYPFVPLENIVGKAQIIFFSMDYHIKDWSIKKPFGIRFNRIFNLINKDIK